MNYLSLMANDLRARQLGCAAVLLAAGVLGCDTRSSDDDSRAPASALQSEPYAMPDPNQVTFAEVRANGTGCPPGSANTSISADGLVFTTTFSNYFTEVNPSLELGVKDCQFEITLRTPNGMSYAVQSFHYSGYAFLQEGVVGRQTASYYFQGTPVVPVESNRTELRGPYESAYLFTDNVPLASRVWSQCGAERNLNVRTRVQVFNGEARRTGYMSLNAVDGSSKLVLQLASRRCDGATSPPSTPEPQPPPVASPQLPRPANVSVEPNLISPDQPFVVQWRKIPDEPLVRYRVQIHAPPSFGSALLWESPETISSSLTYMGISLAFPGVYTATVIARRDSLESKSDAMPFEVRLSATPPPSPPVASPTPSSSLPTWAAPLPGQYALRATRHWTDTRNTIMTAREVSLAEIRETPDGLELVTRLCYAGNSSVGATLDLGSPEYYPEIRRRIILENGTWSTDDKLIAIGYDREGVAACAGRSGQSIPKRPDQVWIRGSTCRCARSPSEIPRADDCRVRDPDGDGEPGLAHEFTSPTGLLRWTANYVLTSRDHFVNGEVRTNGAHAAQLHVDAVSYLQNCVPSGLQCTELSSASIGCSPENNPVQFARLPAPPAGYSKWSCGALLANTDRVLPRAPAPRTRCIVQ